MSYTDALILAAKLALPLTSTPLAQSAAVAASCEASRSAGACAAYCSHVACAAAATSAGEAAPATSRSERSTARTLSSGAAGVKVSDDGPAAAQASKTTASWRSGRPGSSGSSVVPAHTAGAPPGARVCVSAVSFSAAMLGAMAQLTGTVQPAQAGSPEAEKARSSKTKSSRSARCA